MARLLLVEDEKGIAEALSDALQAEGHEVLVAATILLARSHCAAIGPDLVILDWMLPDGQGIDLLREWRSAGTAIPVIFLTARGDLVDKVLGLELGANDYMTKPFEARELIARINVQLRCTQSNGTGGRTEPTLEFAGISLSDESRTATYGEVELELTKMEFNLLKLFLENPNKVFTRDELLNKVWGYESYPTTRTVDNHVLQLRQKTSADLFETVRGVGYRLREQK